MSGNTHETSNGDVIKEKDYGNGGVNGNGAATGANTAHEDALHRVRTAGSIAIPPELFEKMYLSPQTPVKGDLRQTFANPTPL